LLRRLAAYRAVLVVAFARGGDLVHVELDLYLCRECLGPEHRGEQLIDLRVELAFELRLKVEPSAIGIARLGQKFAVLVHHLDGFRPQPRHRCGDEVGDGGDLAVG
jgi:hypothetical protein